MRVLYILFTKNSRILDKIAILRATEIQSIIYNLIIMLWLLNCSCGFLRKLRIKLQNAHNFTLKLFKTNIYMAYENSTGTKNTIVGIWFTLVALFRFKIKRKIITKSITVKNAE